MKNNVNRFFMGSMLLAGVAASGNLHAKNTSNNSDSVFIEKQKKIECFQKENDSLTNRYKQCHVAYADYNKQFKAYAKAYPDCDNMQALVKLSREFLKVAERNYYVLSDSLIKNIERACRAALGPDERIILYVDDIGEEMIPVSKEDWYEVLFNMQGLMPNNLALEQQIKEIDEIESLVWNMSEFVWQEMEPWANLHPARKEIMKKDISRVRQNGSGNLFVLDDSVYLYNSRDNIMQNEIVNRLLKYYLFKLEAYNKKYYLADESVFENIQNLCTEIMQYNDIEAGVISYNQEINDLNKKITKNTEAIKRLKIQNKVR